MIITTVILLSRFDCTTPISKIVSRYGIITTIIISLFSPFHYCTTNKQDCFKIWDNYYYIISLFSPFHCTTNKRDCFKIWNNYYYIIYFVSFWLKYGIYYPESYYSSIVIIYQWLYTSTCIDILLMLYVEKEEKKDFILSDWDVG